MQQQTVEERVADRPGRSFSATMEIMDFPDLLSMMSVPHTSLSLI